MGLGLVVMVCVLSCRLIVMLVFGLGGCWSRLMLMEIVILSC